MVLKKSDKDIVEDDAAKIEPEASIELVQVEMIDSASSWRNRLYDFYHCIDGLAKLRRKKPSTAVLGNWAVFAAFEGLVEKYKPELKICTKYLLGKKSKKATIVIPFSLSDTDEDKQLQWRKFWMYFMESKSGKYVCIVCNFFVTLM